MHLNANPQVSQSLRRVVKSVAATGLHRTGLDRLLANRKGMKNAPLILGYHRVVADFADAAKRSIAPMLVSTNTLERHIDWVGKHYQFVSLDELIEYQECSRVSDKPVAAITFDDGYADVYSNAFPLLKRKGVPFAVFVVSDLVGSEKLQFHDELYLVVSTALAHWQGQSTARLQQVISDMELDSAVDTHLKAQIMVISNPFQMMRLFFENLSKAKNEHLIQELRKLVPVSDKVLKEFYAFNWDMLKEMLAAGVTVGSHSKSHALLANETWETVVNEVTVSRQVLETELGVVIDHFAYPDGRFNAMSIKGVAEAGYRGAYTICSHQDSDHSNLTIPRKVLWENSCNNMLGQFSPSVLGCISNGIFDPANSCDQNHGIG